MTWFAGAGCARCRCWQGRACPLAAGASSAAALHPPAAPGAPGPQNLGSAPAGYWLQRLPESLQLPLPRPYQPLLPQLQLLEPAVQVRLMPPPRAARGSALRPVARWGGRCLALPAHALPASAPARAHAAACAPRSKAVAAAPCQHAAACAPAAARALLRRRADRRRARAGVCQLRERQRAVAGQPRRGRRRPCLLPLLEVLSRPRLPAATHALRAPATRAAAHSSRGC